MVYEVRKGGLGNDLAAVSQSPCEPLRIAGVTDSKQLPRLIIPIQSYACVEPNKEETRTQQQRSSTYI